MRTRLAPALIASALILGGCAAALNESGRYADKLAANDTTAGNVTYYRTAYGEAGQDRPFWGYYAIQSGAALLPLYDGALAGTQQGTILTSMQFTERAYMTHIGFYEKAWSTAIDAHVHSRYTSVDFGTALAIVQHEYRRMGVYAKMDDIMEQTMRNVASLDRDGYPRTYEAYAVLTQLSALAHSPTGSRISYGTMVNSLHSEFGKTLALAELEY